MTEASSDVENGRKQKMKFLGFLSGCWNKACYGTSKNVFDMIEDKDLAARLEISGLI